MSFIYGPNVDVLLPLDDEQILDSGATWFRAPLRLDAPGPATVERLVGKGLEFVGVVDRTTASSSRAQYDAAYGGLVAAVQIGNEWDHVSSSSWTMSPRELLALAAVWAGFAQSQIMGGMADGRPAVLTPELAAAFRYAAFHPYGRRPLPDWPSATWGFGYLGDLAEGYAQAVPSAEFIVSEFGVTQGEMNPTERPRFYAENLRLMLQHHAIVGAFPFGLNNGAGGGADAFRLTQAELDAMRDVLPAETTLPTNPQPPAGGPMKLEELLAQHQLKTWPSGTPADIMRGGSELVPTRRAMIDVPDDLWIEETAGYASFVKGSNLPNP